MVLVLLIIVMSDLLNKTIVADLQSLADADDPDFFQDTIRSYAANVDEILGQIQTLTSANDGKQTIRRLLHQLKGSSYNIGAEKLGDMCEAYEVKVKQTPEQVDYDEMLKALQVLNTETQAALRAA